MLYEVNVTYMGAVTLRVEAGSSEEAEANAYIEFDKLDAQDIYDGCWPYKSEAYASDLYPLERRPD